MINPQPSVVATGLNGLSQIPSTLSLSQILLTGRHCVHNTTDAEVEMTERVTIDIHMAILCPATTTMRNRKSAREILAIAMLVTAAA